MSNLGKHFKRKTPVWNKGLKGNEYLSHYNGKVWNKGLTKETSEIIAKVSRDFTGVQKKAKVTKEYLNYLYNEKKLSANSIGRLLDVSTDIVIRRLKNYEIHVRNKSESLKGRKVTWGYKTGGAGKHRSEETKKKCRELALARNLTGCRNPNWRGGHSEYGELFTRNTRKYIKERDSHVCQGCGIREKKLNKSLTVHHIDYNKKNCYPTNLISLCPWCNMSANGKREIKRIRYSTILDCYYDNLVLNDGRVLAG